MTTRKARAYITGVCIPMTAHTQPDAILVFGEVRAILVLVLLWGGFIIYSIHQVTHQMNSRALSDSDGRPEGFRVHEGVTSMYYKKALAIPPCQRGQKNIKSRHTLEK